VIVRIWRTGIDATLATGTPTGEQGVEVLNVHGGDPPGG
jgi:hypothetical protein